MDYSHHHNIELLAELIGRDAAEEVYRGLLRPLFVPVGERGAHHETLAVARELVMRFLKEELEKAGPLSSPQMVRDYLRLYFSGEEREVFAVVFLDAQHRIIAAEKLFFGTLTQTSVYPREIVKKALAWNTAAVIFAHNHPSGVAEPSQADQMLTETLRRALDLVDVKVLDHFVIGDSTAMSFAERGLV